MNPFSKIWNFFLSTTWGAWCFAFVLILLFGGISAAYLACYGTDEKNFVQDLEPLAVILIGLAAIFIAANNCWGKWGHKITCRLSYTAINKNNLSDMLYFKNILLCNKKDKVEIIDKILLFSEKLGYAKLADFGRNPLSLKNYETKNIPLEPVTAWVAGVNEEDIVEKKSFSLSNDNESIIKTIEKGIHPELYFTHTYQQKEKTKARVMIPKVIVSTQNGLVPVEIYWETENISTIFPIRNTDGFSDKNQEEQAVYGASVIQVTELTLGQSKSGKELENKKIRVFLHNNQERYFFDNFIEENKSDDFTIFFDFSSSETKKFEKEWEEYYRELEEFYISRKYKRIISEMKKIEKNQGTTLSYAQTLEDHFHNKVKILFHKQDLPRISSKITSRVVFLHDVEKFAEYPIVKKRHTLFATAFYSPTEINPCFEEIEESIFSKIRRKIFRKTSPTP